MKGIRWERVRRELQRPVWSDPVSFEALGLRAMVRRLLQIASIQRRGLVVTETWESHQARPAKGDTGGAGLSVGRAGL